MAGLQHDQRAEFYGLVEKHRGKEAVTQLKGMAAAAWKAQHAAEPQGSLL